jgi:hypothetical protein
MTSMMTQEQSAHARAVVDRRIQNRRIVPDRRRNDGATFAGEERRKSPRRKVERRRMIDPTTCERDYTGDEIEFMRAMDEYKRKSGRMFPTWSEVLEVVRGLGYVKPEPTVENTVAPAVN